jgi:hypothetical protein
VCLFDVNTLTHDFFSLISALIAAPDAATRRRLCICEDAHVPARRIGPKLSARIADYWYGETD